MVMMKKLSFYFSVFLRLLKSNIIPLAVLVGLLLKSIYNELKKKRRMMKAFGDWRDHIDFSVIQACIMSTEHLHTLGRIEKRTLFTKKIADVFSNPYILERVLQAAHNLESNKRDSVNLKRDSSADSSSITEKDGISNPDPILCTKLKEEDKWHVLNTCTNHISELFAAYHVFFNEARRNPSYYKSAWYCFTLTCRRTEGKGRFFITPYKPVAAEDRGILRIRIVMVNEEELRGIACGDISPPSWGFFNSRHEGRWKVLHRFAGLFLRQLEHMTGQHECADWGPNLCGRFTAEAKNKGQWTGKDPEYCDEDNCFLRIHIPFPGSKDLHRKSAEDKCRDVVLFE